MSIRWVLVRDPLAQFTPQALLCTDPTATPAQIVGWFVQRWQVEVTLQASRTHLGLETQRQWNPHAILRTTPALLGLFSLVTLCAQRLLHGADLPPRQSAWYTKEAATFADTLAFVRTHLWPVAFFAMSPIDPDNVVIPRSVFSHVRDLLAFAA